MGVLIGDWVVRLYGLTTLWVTSAGRVGGFDYEHEHRFAEHEKEGGGEHEHRFAEHEEVGGGEHEHRFAEHEEKRAVDGTGETSGTAIIHEGME